MSLRFFFLDLPPGMFITCAMFTNNNINYQRLKPNVPCVHGTVDYYAIVMGEKSDSG